MLQIAQLLLAESELYIKAYHVKSSISVREAGGGAQDLCDAIGPFNLFRGSIS